METRITGQDLQNLKKEVTSFNAQLRQRQRSVGGENLDKDAFLRLLTIQISRQDPLAPMKNTEFVAQMAQFTALEQMKNMNASMEKLKDDMAVMPMFSMIGKEISYYDVKTETYRTGIAEGIHLNKDGEALIASGKEKIELANIVAVKNKAPTPLSSYEQLIKTQAHTQPPPVPVRATPTADTSTPTPALTGEDGSAADEKIATAAPVKN